MTAGTGLEDGIGLADPTAADRSARARSTSRSHVVLLDGWQHRRPPGHWQGWLAQEFVDRGGRVSYPTLPRPDDPRIGGWRDAILDAIPGPDATVVAHGLSCRSVLRLAGEPELLPIARRILLVAPPSARDDANEVAGALTADVGAQDVARLASDELLVVAGSDDPYSTIDPRREFGERLGIRVVVIEGGGHLNEGSGYGPWPEVLAWVEHGVWPTTAEPSPCAADDAATVAPCDLRPILRRHYRPSGVRLGVLLDGELDPALGDVVDDVVELAGLRAARRVARVSASPATGERTADDVIDFVRRYGHEYAVAVWSAADLDPDGRARVEAALAAAGTHLIWIDEGSR